MGPAAHDVPYGTGVSDIPGILEVAESPGLRGQPVDQYEYHSGQFLAGSRPMHRVCPGLRRGKEMVRRLLLCLTADQSCHP